MTVHGRYTGVLRDDFESVWATQNQDYPNAAGAFRAQNMPRRSAANVASTLTSGTMLATALYLAAGDTVTSLTFVSGTTGAATPTSWWFALYDNSATPALLAQTADQGSAAWSTTTAKTLALSAPVTVDTSGVYYAAVMVAAGTAPTLIGCSGSSAAVLAGDPILARTQGSSLTGTAPATITGSTTVNTIPLVVAS